MVFSAKDFIAAIADACASSRASTGMKVVAEESTYKEYVTHLIHLQGEGTPMVEKAELARLGIECVKLYGRKDGDGEGGMLYDGTALGQALKMILGGNTGLGVVSRRNTLVDTLNSGGISRG